ncbi:MAG TPA: hypothetical protein VNF92_12835 [Gemmatimonadaceae bacterium]|nr:hypothetical protein [Gemmatimonadaceae bacterium]
MISLRLRSVLAGLLIVPVAAAPSLAQRRGRGGPPPAPQPLHFQFVGPASGGRIASISGVPGDTAVWYLGSASGGVWKSVDGGHSFGPVFDKEPVQAIGALAVAPSDPKIVWAGTGEAWAIRDADVMGDGVYKSTDAGMTWQHMGLDQTGRIGRIIVNPTNPDIVYVCALGRATGPQQERGVYRTMDGGKTWTRVLFVDENTGCSGLTLDPHNPAVLFAGMWELQMHTYAEYSGGPSSGIYVTRDSGATWTHVEDAGLPHEPLGKIDVAVAPSASNRVYALIQTADQGSVWRSDDGGHTWHVVSWSRLLIGRAGYYIHLVVNSGNADEVLVANSSFWRSTDGGKTWESMPWGGDNHDIWMDPISPDHFGITYDGGASVTTDHGRTMTRIGIPNAQMYHVAVDNQVPYWVYGNRQDDGTMRGPSDAVEAPNGFDPTRIISFDSSAMNQNGRGGRGGRGGGGFGGRGGFGAGFTRTATWDHNLGGCESGFTIPDPTDHNIVWATCYADEVSRYDARTGLARAVSPWIHTLDFAPNQAKYRCHWTPPLAIDPFDHNTVYYGCQVIFKTTNGGQSWSVISPDLSTRDSSRIVSSGGLVGDNLGQFAGEVVFAIAPSSIQRGLIWAGTNDGKVWYTRDGGLHWNDVSKNVNMPAWGTVREISPSVFDPGTAYMAVDYHMMDDRDPFIFKTTDYGRTWTKISDALPHGGPLDYVMTVVENPNRKGMLFAGTGHAFYYSMDDGAHWTHDQAGLPAAPVSWIVVPKLWHDVVVSTYGRGIYIMHDITTLEQGDQVPADAAVYFYEPRPAFRQARSGSADFLFRLKSAPEDSVELQIADARGTVIRTMKQAGRAGENLMRWNLEYDGPAQVELRTVAPDNPHIWDEPRFKGKDTRPVTHWGIEGPQRAGPMAVPGKYTAKLTVDGKSYTRPFEVIPDPAIASSQADLEASLQAQLRIRGDMNETVGMINRLEVMRHALEEQAKAAGGDADRQKALAAMNDKLMNVETMLISRENLNSDDKYFVTADKVYLNLIWLYAEVGGGGGDVAGGSDYKPTDTSMEVLQMIEKDLAAGKGAYEAFMKNDLSAYDKLAGTKIIP